jgi:3-hydroxyisobutyrate dehydrogenase-like beta-hydroxyacid dehydrogenase
MAAAYSKALAAAGIELVGPDGDLRDCDILSAAFDGRETLAALRRLDRRGVRNIVDLATQSIADAGSTGAACKERGIPYFAGGVTGGVAQVGSAEFAIILGPVRPGTQLPSWLGHLGRIAPQASVEAAVSAKLLHNLVLILSNHALGVALELAEAAEIRDFQSILTRGTAGRPILQASTVRDRDRGFSSSYSSSLVAKDLRAMMDSLPELRSLRGFDLAQLASAHDSRGDEPYTGLANSQISSRRGI